MSTLYDADQIERLFDEMAGTYEMVNYISSFGFSLRWRRQFITHLSLTPGMTVCDLMCGMGECWDVLLPQLDATSRLIGIDLSNGMLKGAHKKRTRFAERNIQISKQNALVNTLDSNSIDAVICGFGIKTLDATQMWLFAQEVRRVLKPGGTFSLIEISVPTDWFLKGLYRFYVSRVIPVVGQLLLGNPDNYRMLGQYMERFGNCKAMALALHEIGLNATYHEYFYGCATGVSGSKPI